MANRSIIRELVAWIGVELDPAAARELEQFDEALDEVKTAFFAIQGAAAAGAGTLWMWVKSAADAGDAASKNAQRLGVTAEEYQRLAYAAQMSGTDVQALGAAFRTMGRVVVGASEGNRSAREVLRDLGVSATDAGGALKANGVIFAEALEALSAMENGARKNTLAMQIFGRSAVDLVPLLNSGKVGIAELMAEADRLGIVMGGELTQQAETFGDELARLGLVVEGVKNQVGGALIPEVTRILTQTREWVMQNRALIQGRLTAFLRQVAEGLKLWWAYMKPLIVGLGGLVGGLMGGIQAMGGFGQALKFATMAWTAFTIVSRGPAMLNLLSAAFGSSGAAATLWGNATFRAALTAKAAMLGWTLLLLGLLLVLEDVYQAFTGGESVFAEWGEALAGTPLGQIFGEQFRLAVDTFGEGALAFVVGTLASIGSLILIGFGAAIDAVGRLLGALGASLWEWIGAWIDGVVARITGAFTVLFDWLRKTATTVLSPVSTVLGALGTVGDAIGGLLRGGASGSVPGAASAVTAQILAESGPRGVQADMARQANTTIHNAGAAPITQNVRGGDIVVNVPAGSDAVTVAQRVGQVVEDSTAKAARQLVRDRSPAPQL